jgi:hypothetical protein
MWLTHRPMAVVVQPTVEPLLPRHPLNNYAAADENIRGNVILQVVTRSTPQGTLAQHSYTHRILTGHQGHR